jgi:Kef-type K+ transport system membrane component KefB
MAEHARGEAMKPKTILVYGAMLAAAAGIFLWIRSAGESLVAPARVELGHYAQNAPTTAVTSFTHVLLALVVIILAARGVGAIFRRFNQPAVVGEMIAGILLGPSLLGQALPGTFAYLFPSQMEPYLSVIANIGVILYMFLVGVELNGNLLRERRQASVATSHASIVAPFLLGSAMALWLYPLYSTSDIRFVVFALFMGVSMSVTAFPVLARVVTDRGMQEDPLGATALACAAVDDVTAWCLFALVVSVARSQAQKSLLTLVLTGGFILTVFFVVRPGAIWLARRYAQRQQTGQSSIVIACITLLLAALTTQWIGIHALFGAFLVGAVIPHDSPLAKDIRQKFEDLVLILFLPVFFAFTGLRTQIGLVHGAGDWTICIAIIIVASLGKFGGGTIAARLTGLNWQEAASLGILMNTRGLMELIVLNVGMDLGVLSPTLFAMLVIMAIVTTVTTTPVLQALARGPEPVAARG